MMNIKNAVEEKFDVIVAALVELNESDKVISTKELIPILEKAYDQILPAPAKMFVKPYEFLNACLEHEEKILRALNKEIRKKAFTILQ